MNQFLNSTRFWVLRSTFLPLGSRWGTGNFPSTNVRVPLDFIYFMVLLLSKSFPLCEIFRLNNFPLSLANVLIYFCTAFLWLVSFTCFATMRNDETPICGWTILLSAGKIQDTDKHENLTKTITNCNLPFDSFQTKKIRNDLRFCEARWSGSGS